MSRKQPRTPLTVPPAPAQPQVACPIRATCGKDEDGCDAHCDAHPHGAGCDCGADGCPPCVPVREGTT